MKFRLMMTLLMALRYFLQPLETSINAELLKFGALYNWRVRALHAFDISDWSESWTFTTVNTVNLETPANGAINVQLSPPLDMDGLNRHCKL